MQVEFFCTVATSLVPRASTGQRIGRHRTRCQLIRPPLISTCSHAHKRGAYFTPPALVDLFTSLLSYYIL